MPPPAEEEEETPDTRPEPTRIESGTAALQQTNSADVNGVSQDVDEISPAPRVNGSQMPSFNQTPLQPAKASTSPTAAAPPPATDSEGFSVAPSASDAITQVEQEAAYVVQPWLSLLLTQR